MLWVLGFVVTKKNKKTFLPVSFLMLADNIWTLFGQSQILPYLGREEQNSQRFNFMELESGLNISLGDQGRKYKFWNLSIWNMGE